MRFKFGVKIRVMLGLGVGLVNFREMVRDLQFAFLFHRPDNRVHKHLCDSVPNRPLVNSAVHILEVHFYHIPLPKPCNKP